MTYPESKQPRACFSLFRPLAPSAEGARAAFFVAAMLAATLFIDGLANQTFAVEPIAVAHRGLSRHAPENTLPAFSTCVDLGIGIELDIRTTQDGRLVVLHDDTVGRTTNGRNVSIRQLTLAAAQKLDAGSWFGPTFKNVRIPTLEEALSLVAARKREPTILALNVKQLSPAGEQAFVDLVAKYDLFAESFAFDQNAAMSRRLKKIDPRMRIGRNVGRNDVERRLRENDLDVFLLTFAPDKKTVERLHRHGKQVLYNFAGPGAGRRNPAVWKQVQTAGIDGLLTDYPLECLQAWRADGDKRQR